MTTPKLSIVIPCWNAGRHLPGLFDNLRSQTLREIEIILADDGSTDPLTIETFGLLPDNVTLISQENRGLSSARSVGFSASSGEYVLPLDCDDRLAPGFIDKTVAVLDQDYSLDFSFTHVLLTGARKGVLERGFNRFDQLFLNQLPYSLVLRRTAWERVGGYDETMRSGYEDWDFNLRLIMTGSTGGLVPEPLFIYRVAQDGMLLSKSARRHAELWARIRKKHPAAYKLGALMSCWRREKYGRVSPLVAAGLLVAATLLPSEAFGLLYHSLLTRRARTASQ